MKNLSVMFQLYQRTKLDFFHRTVYKKSESLFHLKFVELVFSVVTSLGEKKKVPLKHQTKAMFTAIYFLNMASFLHVRSVTPCMNSHVTNHFCFEKIFFVVFICSPPYRTQKKSSSS